MKDLGLRIYGSLPYALRVVAASLRGCQMRRWRYCRETDRLVEAALERETWSTSQWSAWQEERLHGLLQRAVTHVPFYRGDVVGGPVVSGHSFDWSRLENWP